MTTCRAARERGRGGGGGGARDRLNPKRILMERVTNAGNWRQLDGDSAKRAEFVR